MVELSKEWRRTISTADNHTARLSPMLMEIGRPFSGMRLRTTQQEFASEVGKQFKVRTIKRPMLRYLSHGAIQWLTKDPAGAEQLSRSTSAGTASPITKPRLLMEYVKNSEHIDRKCAETTYPTTISGVGIVSFDKYRCGVALLIADVEPAGYPLFAAEKRGFGIVGGRDVRIAAVSPDIVPGQFAQIAEVSGPVDVVSPIAHDLFDKFAGSSVMALAIDCVNRPRPT